MNRTFDFALIHTTAVILSTGSGDKYEECSADITAEDIQAIGNSLADHRFGGLRNDEEAYVQTGWLIIDTNNDGECFALTDETGHVVVECSPERAHQLFLNYLRESVEGLIDVSEANKALIAE